jgi:hypothetical protein
LTNNSCFAIAMNMLKLFNTNDIDYLTKFTLSMTTLQAHS